MEGSQVDKEEGIKRVKDHSPQQSPNDAQGEVRDDIEHEDGNFKKGQAPVMDGIKSLYRDGKPFGMHPINEVMRECDKHEPEEQ